MEIHHEWAGLDSGPVLVLSHSLGASREMWKPQVDALGREFRLLLSDHRGHGKSALPPGPWSIADFGRDLLDLLDRLDLERVHFCGLSLGGMVGLWLGQEAPERVEKLVLCNCCAKIEDPSLLRGRMKQIEREGLGSIAENVLERWLTADFRAANPEKTAGIREMFLATPPKAYTETCGALCEMDLTPKLGEIQAPSLVIYGRHDLATPPAWSKAFASEMPDARLLELDSAHLSNVEAADGFNEAVAGFLSR